MDIKNEMTVTVYRFPKTVFLKSAFCNLETYIDDYPVVAYSEDMGLLFQCIDAFQYSHSEYIKDIMDVDSTEMTYEEYVRQYKEKLNNMYPDAPVLNDVYATQHLSEQQRAVNSEFKPVNPYERLTSLGINFQIR